MSNNYISSSFAKDYPVSAWNHNTKADGEKLTQDTIQPLIKRTDMLASATDSISSLLEENFIGFSAVNFSNSSISGYYNLSGELYVNTDDNFSFDINDKSATLKLSNNITGGNLTFNNISSTNLSSINISSNNLSSINISSTEISSDNISSNNLSSINISSNNLSSDSGYVNNLSSTLFSSNNANIIGLSSKNISADNSVISAGYFNELSGNTITGNNISANTLEATSATITAANITSGKFEYIDVHHINVYESSAQLISGVSAISGLTNDSVISNFNSAFINNVSSDSGLLVNISSNNIYANSSYINNFSANAASANSLIVDSFTAKDISALLTAASVVTAAVTGYSTESGDMINPVNSGKFSTNSAITSYIDYKFSNTVEIANEITTATNPIYIPTVSAVRTYQNNNHPVKASAHIVLYDDTTNNNISVTALTSSAQMTENNNNSALVENSAIKDYISAQMSNINTNDILATGGITAQKNISTTSLNSTEIETKNLLVNGVERVNGNLYVTTGSIDSLYSKNIYCDNMNGKSTCAQNIALVNGGVSQDYPICFTTASSCTGSTIYNNLNYGSAFTINYGLNIVKLPQLYVPNGISARALSTEDDISANRNLIVSGNITNTGNTTATLNCITANSANVSAITATNVTALGSITSNNWIYARNLSCSRSIYCSAMNITSSLAVGELITATNISSTNNISASIQISSPKISANNLIATGICISGTKFLSANDSNDLATLITTNKYKTDFWINPNVDVSIYATEFEKMGKKTLHICPITSSNPYNGTSKIQFYNNYPSVKILVHICQDNNLTKFFIGNQEKTWYTTLSCNEHIDFVPNPRYNVIHFEFVYDNNGVHRLFLSDK